MADRVDVRSGGTAEVVVGGQGGDPRTEGERNAAQRGRRGDNIGEIDDGVNIEREGGGEQRTCRALNITMVYGGSNICAGYTQRIVKPTALRRAERRRRNWCPRGRTRLQGGWGRSERHQHLRVEGPDESGAQTGPGGAAAGRGAT